MEKGKAVAIVECNGLPTAIAFLDTALKSANVELLGMELSKGDARVDIKLSGNIGAVKAATEAGISVANTVGGILGKVIIPRPSNSIDCMLKNDDNIFSSANKNHRYCNLQSRFLDPKLKTSSNKDTKDSSNDEIISSISLKTEEFPKEELPKEELPKEELPKEELPKEELPKEELYQKDIKKGNVSEIIDDMKPNVSKEQSVLKTLSTEYTCNLCKDPKCTRIKGKPHSECIHNSKDR